MVPPAEMNRSDDDDDDNPPVLPAVLVAVLLDAVDVVFVVFVVDSGRAVVKAVARPGMVAANVATTTTRTTKI